jgi:hypothetical protein
VAVTCIGSQEFFWQLTALLPTCHFPASPTSIPTVQPLANAITPSGLITDQVAFYHAAMFSPVLSTWCDAIDAGHLTTWPAPTSRYVAIFQAQSQCILATWTKRVQTFNPPNQPVHHPCMTKLTLSQHKSLNVPMQFLWIYILQLAKYSLTKQVGLPPHQHLAMHIL